MSSAAAAPGDAHSPEPIPPPQSSPDPVSRYERLIARLEADQGAYGGQLVEAWLGLGLLHQQAGDHPQALRALQSALQSLRVNEGLYSMNQAGILEAIIDSNIALQARDALRRNYEQLFWLYRRNYGEHSAALVPLIKRLGKWYFELYSFSPPATTVEPLIAADELYARALKLLPGNSPPQDRVNILYNVAVLNYHVAEDVLDPMLSHREIRESMIPNGRGSPYVNETAVREYYAWQSFFRGKRSLTRVLEIYEKNLPGSIMEYARALIFMGDWYTVQRRVPDGARLYKRAWDALAEHGVEQARIDELLGAPQPIEQLPIPGEAQPEAGADSYYVDALLDVPAAGWPQNIRIQAVHPPGETALRRRGRRAIAATRYRPRFEEGRAVATEDVPLRYIFRHREQPGWFHF